jgi:hypothetical protein
MHHTTTPGQAMHFCCIKATRAWLPPMAAGGIKKVMFHTAITQHNSNNNA